MYLLTDDQTIEDLRLFSKRERSGIYDLYNHTHTRGGEAVLEEMFRRPLGNKDAIRKRSEIIACFAEKGTHFPFSASIFDMAEKYLLNDQEMNRTAQAQTILSEKDINNGVGAVIELLQLLQAFILQDDVTANSAFAQDLAAIQSLLADPALQPVFKELHKGKLSYAAVTAFDLLFRIRERNKIQQLLGLVYQLDVYLSVARVAVERGFVFPKVLPEGSKRLVLEGVYHPELKQPVGNSVWMSNNRNLIFLTGANMAGKSTFLRAFSTAVYVAHMGFPVAARSMEFTVLDGLFTTINLPDNLGIGASHFYAEVLRVKKVATELHAGRSLLIVFDELFRGTNVKDAHEATVAITRSFAEKQNSFFIISSHIVEAGEELAEAPTIAFHYLPTRMNGHVPEYTYTLEEGITADRHGMIIIRNEKILDILREGRKNNRKKELVQSR
ncbi:MutS-related protein [Pseudoflavitalea rhizosphaerae]|uniref:MutS-related protein n=1 Tax=Pseudoflavitalea rhizosphaerae TaxID=1884793 RepID=UPI000F8E2DA5|nr:DNA mismatch repair protein [Pseudoflavitalea rhizosphaerae]